MCIFKYREKRYGKLTLFLFSVLMLALSAACVYGAVMAGINLSHWSKFILIVVAGIAGLLFGLTGFYCFTISLSMINKSKSVRDGNRSKGISGTRLCDKCGKVISKVAEFCEHCGAKQQSGLGMKKCPNCKTKNSATAAFCEKCRYEFKDDVV